MDMLTIDSALTSFKTAVDIIKKLIALKAFSDHQGLLIDLNSAVISAQTITLQFQVENAALVTEKTNLEKELVRLKTWEAEKQRYDLKEVGSRVFAYVLKESMSRGEPMHWLCSNCYASGIKSVLQFTGGAVYQCPKCRHEISLGSGEPSTVETDFDPRQF